MTDAGLTCWRFVARLAAAMAQRRRVRVFYTGRVQGVGFRYTAREVACGYEVTGFVRNMADGRVELLAEGTEEELTAFVSGIGQSDLAGHIRQADVRWEDPTGEFKRFEIRF